MFNKNHIMFMFKKQKCFDKIYVISMYNFLITFKGTCILRMKKDVPAPKN